jgi:hypothetical protein
LFGYLIEWVVQRAKGRGNISSTASSSKRVERKPKLARFWTSLVHYPTIDLRNSVPHTIRPNLVL